MKCVNWQIITKTKRLFLCVSLDFQNFVRRQKNSLKQIYMFVNKKVFEKIRQKMSFHSNVSSTSKSKSSVDKSNVESSKSVLHPEMIPAALLSESTTTIMSSTISSSSSLLSSRRTMKSTNVGQSFNAGGFMTLRHPGTHSTKLSNL